MKKKKVCKHEWTQPQDRQKYEGRNGEFDIWDISHTITPDEVKEKKKEEQGTIEDYVVYVSCKKCAEEKIIRKSYHGKNYV